MKRQAHFRIGCAAICAALLQGQDASPGEFFENSLEVHAVIKACRSFDNACMTVRTFMQECALADLTHLFNGYSELAGMERLPEYRAYLESVADSFIAGNEDMQVLEDPYGRTYFLRLLMSPRYGGNASCKRGGVKPHEPAAGKNALTLRTDTERDRAAVSMVMPAKQGSRAAALMRKAVLVFFYDRGIVMGEQELSDHLHRVRRSRRHRQKIYTAWMQRQGRNPRIAEYTDITQNPWSCDESGYLTRDGLESLLCLDMERYLEYLWFSKIRTMLGWGIPDDPGVWPLHPGYFLWDKSLSLRIDSSKMQITSIPAGQKTGKEFNISIASPDEPERFKLLFTLKLSPFGDYGNEVFLTEQFHQRRCDELRPRHRGKYPLTSLCEATGFYSFRFTPVFAPDIHETRRYYMCLLHPPAGRAPETVNSVFLRNILEPGINDKMLFYNLGAAIAKLYRRPGGTKITKAKMLLPKAQTTFNEVNLFIHNRFTRTKHLHRCIIRHCGLILKKYSDPGALFWQMLISPYCHGDLHNGNIFYDAASGCFSLAFSPVQVLSTRDEWLSPVIPGTCLNPGDVTTDIAYALYRFYIHSFAMAGQEPSSPHHVKYMRALNGFLAGLLAGYPAEIRRPLADLILFYLMSLCVTLNEEAFTDGTVLNRIGSLRNHIYHKYDFQDG